MIISNDREVGFIRVTKTGSTSAAASIYQNTASSLIDICTGYQNFGYKCSQPKSDVIQCIENRLVDLGINAPVEYRTRITEVLLEHMPLQLAYNIGLVSDSMLDNYEFYAFVRHPINRWLSAYFHNFSASSQEELIRFIRSGSALPKVFEIPLRTWFEVNGDVVVQPLTYENFNKSERFLRGKFGAYKDTEYNYMSGTKPDWAKVNYSDWMPDDCLQALQIRLKDDLIFLESINTEYNI